MLAQLILISIFEKIPVKTLSFHGFFVILHRQSNGAAAKQHILYKDS